MCRLVSVFPNARHERFFAVSSSFLIGGDVSSVEIATKGAWVCMWYLLKKWARGVW